MTRVHRGLSRYELGEIAGSGGQGHVVRAWDRVENRQVAIKIREFALEGEREDLLSEARILLGLRPHPRLPLVLGDFFEVRRYYLVTEWVEGESLQHLLDRKGAPGLPHREALRYLAQVAEAVD